MMSKHFVTFANRNFEGALVRITKQAEDLSYFKSIYGYREVDIQKDSWWDKNGQFIRENPKGYGYWIWKPYIIRDYMDRIPDGDIILYADAGCEINKYGIVKLDEFFDFADRNGICAFQTGHIERDFNLVSLFEYLNVDDTMKESGQLVGGIIYIKKTDDNIKLLDEWIRLCEHNDYQFLKTPNKTNHRHDQSIFSLLMKINGRAFIQGDLTYFGKGNPAGREYPVHASRNRHNRSVLKYT